MAAFRRSRSGLKEFQVQRSINVRERQNIFVDAQKEKLQDLQCSRLRLQIQENLWLNGLLIQFARVGEQQDFLAGEIIEECSTTHFGPLSNCIHGRLIISSRAK